MSRHLASTKLFSLASLARAAASSASRCAYAAAAPPCPDATAADTNASAPDEEDDDWDCVAADAGDELPTARAAALAFSAATRALVSRALDEARPDDDDDEEWVDEIVAPDGTAPRSSSLSSPRNAAHFL
jgi:hypothetical protein